MKWRVRRQRSQRNVPIGSGRPNGSRPAQFDLKVAGVFAGLTICIRQSQNIARSACACLAALAWCFQRIKFYPLCSRVVMRSMAKRDPPNKNIFKPRVQGPAG